MAEYSRFPAIHEFLGCNHKISMPIISWNEVLTTHPAFYHFQWAFVFAVMMFAVHMMTVWITKFIAPFIMDYREMPPIPVHPKLERKHYAAVARLSSEQYSDLSKLPQYKLASLNRRYCSGELTTKELSEWLMKCHRHKMEIELNEQRFRECLFPVITKGFSLYFGVLAMYQKEWVYDRAMFYQGWPYEQGLDCCIPDIKFLYMYHVGWYIWKLIAQIYVDRQLKDFAATMIHHFCAVGLLTLSYYSGTVRGGTVVLLLHDPADVVLSSGKLFRLIGCPILMNTCFMCLVITWFLTRIVLFPMSPLASAWIDFYEQHGNKNASDDFVIMTCCIMMLALYILHLNWFRLIINAAVKTLKGGETRDSRSDFEEDEEEDEEQKMEETESKPLLKEADKRH